MTAPAKIPCTDVVFALFDGDYHLGLGALINSLCKCGFQGVVHVGYRGDLPAWGIPGREFDGDHQCVVGERCALRFTKVDSAVHLARYKPTFMLNMLRTHANGAERIYYFDVDIVVKAPWDFFRDWVSCGIAVCRDASEPHMSFNHPLRRYWRQLAEEFGLESRSVDGYYSSGFVGLGAAQIPFLETWQSFIELAERTGIALEQLVHGHRPNPFHMPDQDMLNAALMATTFPISPVEQSGMDFTPGGYIMSHAVGRAKPWRRRYIIDALLGYPPDQAHKLYWRHVREPIVVMPAHRELAARLSLATAAAIGRFYRRL